MQAHLKAIVGRTPNGYDRPVTVGGVLMGRTSFAKCYPVSWWNYQPADGGRLEQHADLSRVRDRAVLMFKRKLAVITSADGNTAQAAGDISPEVMVQIEAANAQGRVFHVVCDHLIMVNGEEVKAGRYLTSFSSLLVARALAWKESNGKLYDRTGTQIELSNVNG